VLEKGAGDRQEPPSSEVLTEAMADVESLEHRLRHMAPEEARRQIHEQGRALARQRTGALDTASGAGEHKTASPFSLMMRALGEGLLGPMR
jgi:hypothetical protein